MTFVSSFGMVKSDTMIAKVCDRESRQDSWFENRLAKRRGLNVKSEL